VRLSAIRRLPPRRRLYRARASVRPPVTSVATPLQIAGLVATGKTNRQIAGELYLSTKNIESHLSRIFTKLGVSSRAAMATAIERSRAEQRVGAG